MGWLCALDSAINPRTYTDIKLYAATSWLEQISIALTLCPKAGCFRHDQFCPTSPPSGAGTYCIMPTVKGYRRLQICTSTSVQLLKAVDQAAILLSCSAQAKQTCTQRDRQSKPGMHAVNASQQLPSMYEQHQPRCQSRTAHSSTMHTEQQTDILRTARNLDLSRTSKLAGPHDKIARSP